MGPDGPFYPPPPQAPASPEITSYQHSVICRLCRGFLANRTTLAAELSLEPDSPVEKLVEELYGRLGPSLAERLVGDVTWVVEDRRSGRLVAGRGRLGAHTLYFTRASAGYILASSLEVLLEAVPKRPELHLPALIGQIEGLGPNPGETLFAGVQELEAGSWLSLSAFELKTYRYWRPKPKPLLVEKDDAEYARCFDELLSQVVGEQVGREGLGLTLSSGVDSSTLAVTLAQVCPPGGWTALTWAATELPEADESREAAELAERLGARCLPVEASRRWPLSHPIELAPPLAGPPATHYVSLWEATFETARQHGVRTLLTGAGGDELFGGNVYAYPDLLLTGRWCRLVRELRNHLPISDYSLPALCRGMIVAPLVDAYVRLGRRGQALVVPWLAPDWRRPVASRQQPPYFLLPGRQQRLALLESPLLARVARELQEQAGRHGLELVHPFLDHRLVELAARLPTTQTFRAGRRKGIVARAMAGWLPAATLDRRDKIYPNPIAERGLKSRERDKVLGLMTAMRAAELGLVEQSRLRLEYQRYLRGEAAESGFWHTLTLEAWLRHHGL